MPNEPKLSIKYLPLMVGAILFVLTAVVWRFLDQKERDNLRGNAQEECNHRAALVELDISTRIPDLARMARTGNDLRVEAEMLHGDLRGFQAIEWVDRDSVIQWAVPMEGNASVIGKNLAEDKIPRSAMDRAKETRGPVSTPPVELMQGGKGFLVFFPVYSGDVLSGYLTAVFNVDTWLDYVLSRENVNVRRNDLRLRVSLMGAVAYEQDGWDKLAKNDLGITSEARMLDSYFHIELRPTERFMAQNRTPVPLIVAMFGGLLTVLISMLVFFYQKSYQEAWVAYTARKEIEPEIRQRKKAERRLRQVLTRMEWATRSANMGIWSLDLATKKLTWNETMYRLLEVPSDVKPVYDTWRNLVHPDDISHIEERIAKAIAGEAPLNAEFRYLLGDGVVRTMRTTGRVERAEDGTALSMTGLNWDVTEAKKTEEMLKKSEERVRLILNSTGEAIYGIDMSGNCTFANPSCARILGYPDTDSFIGKNMHNLIHYAFADGTPMPNRECKIFRAFREGKPSHVDDEVLWRFDGTCFPAEYWSYPQLSGNTVIGAVVTFVDITERKTAEETIRHMATHDGMTDLPRLKLFRDRLEMAIKQARRKGLRVAVMFLDLDGFKAVNDERGHDAGDDVLRETARRLLTAVRETDSVARVGGDEFLAAITELVDPETVASVAKKIIALIDAPFQTESGAVTIGISVGIAVYPDDARDIDALINHADQAMYIAKKSGKNGYRFFSSGGYAPELPTDGEIDSAS